MDINRKPFQGVANIVRFNWHFYLIAFILLFSILLFNHLLPEAIQSLIYWLIPLISLPLFISLAISYYIYDVSDLYSLKWLNNCNNKKVLSINAGFDETSELIESKIINSELVVCDFYDPSLHTEVSIKRARKAYPPYKNTIKITSNKLPFQDNSIDATLAILSAHEIRDETERVSFFKELHRVTKPNGQVFITEHLRDRNNFIAYTIGFFHFHSKPTWMKTFSEANFKVEKEIKTTPFITTFILAKHGNTH